MSTTVTHLETDEEWDRVVREARIRCMISLSVKTRRGPDFWLSYYGVLSVKEPDTDWTDDTGYRHQVKGRRYRKTLPIERLSAGDPLMDAMNAREDCARAGQLP